MTAEVTQLWGLFSLFPALAGVIPAPVRWKTAAASFPRTRGGDPHSDPMITRLYAFSPHSRGVIPVSFHVE